MQSIMLLDCPSGAQVERSLPRHLLLPGTHIAHMPIDMPAVHSIELMQVSTTSAVPSALHASIAPCASHTRCPTRPLHSEFSGLHTAVPVSPLQVSPEAH